MIKVIYCALMLGAIFGIFSACSDDEIELSKGNNISKEKLEEIESVDSEDLKELKHIFKDNKNISAQEKPILLIFGKNNCKYCEMLKKDIKEDSNLSELLEKQFDTYYINVDYTKIHHVQLQGNALDIRTSELAKKFNIYPTPTLIFLAPNGAQIFTYPGYLQAKKLENVLTTIVKNPTDSNLAKTLHTITLNR